MSPSPKNTQYVMPVRELMEILTAHTADDRARARARRSRRLGGRLASDPLVTPRLVVPAALSRSRDVSSR